MVSVFYFIITKTKKSPEIQGVCRSKVGGGDSHSHPVYIIIIPRVETQVPPSRVHAREVHDTNRWDPVTGMSFEKFWNF